VIKTTFKFKKNPGLTAAQVHQQVLMDIAIELERARIVYPSNEYMSTALHSESGECAQAVVKHSHGKGTVQQIYEEAIQTAVVAIRLIEEGSREHKFQGLLNEYGNNSTQ
jgi:hypothetical protein